MEANTFKYNVVDGTLDLYPVMLHDATLRYGEGEEDYVDLPVSLPLMGGWAKGCGMKDSEAKRPLPTGVDLTWLSLTEKKFYYCCEDLNTKELQALWNEQDENEKPLFDTLVVGFAPKGRVAMWVKGPLRSEQVMWADSVEEDVDMEDFIPERPDLTCEEFCQYYLDDMTEVAQNLQCVGLPSATELDDMMKRYIYRYNVALRHYNEANKKWEEQPEGTQPSTLQSIHDMRTDSSFDRSGGKHLTSYHRAAQPISICVKWLEGETADYAAYVCITPSLLQPLIEMACIEDEDEPFDVEIKIDSEQNKYQVVLRSQWVPKGITVPEDMMKIIVFRAGFEYYKSKNFNLGSGAWTW
ncbi:MAG: DUF2931 family protein [Bacteroidales bacterium]|nr:DUF2931 family protein [Candidatus Physcousia equi]